MQRSKSYSRTKGHSAERDFAKRFRDIGFEFCKTSRQASRLLDDCGIDLSGIPLNVQIKSGYKAARPKADVLFKEMKEVLAKNFPPGDSIHNNPRVLIHKLDGLMEENLLVTMTWVDWVEFLKAYKQVKNL